MTEPTLRRLLHQLVAVSLASPLALAAGCGGTGLPDPGPFASPVCSGSGVLALDGLMTATPLDYLELRSDPDLEPLAPGPIDGGRLLVAGRFVDGPRPVRLLDNLRLAADGTVAE